LIETEAGQGRGFNQRFFIGGDGMAAGKTERTQISVRLSDDLLDQIQQMAKKERRTRSNMIEYLLREKLREMGKK
jgi:hypothetical protein